MDNTYDDSKPSALIRNLVLLDLIPSHTPGISTPVLVEKLQELGYHISERSVQRDLAKFHKMGLFALDCDRSEKPYRWRRALLKPQSLMGIKPDEALAWNLAQSMLKRLLPMVSYSRLQRMFIDAENMLVNQPQNGLAAWRQRIRVIPNGVTLKMANIDERVWDEVSQAFLQGTQLKVKYQSRAAGKIKTLTLHPHGLVVRNSTTYLVATARHYKELNRYAMHRILSATTLRDNARIQESFDIDDYIQRGAFGWGDELLGNTTLIADISPALAQTLSETPLSDEQTISDRAVGNYKRLEATVLDASETLWWLFSLNQHIIVHQPEKWREAIIAGAKNVLSHYQAD